MTAKEMLGAGLEAIALVQTPLDTAKAQVTNAITQFDVELKQAFEDGKVEGAKEQGVDKIYSKAELDAIVEPLKTQVAALTVSLDTAKTEFAGKIKVLNDFVVAEKAKWVEVQASETAGETAFGEMLDKVVAAFAPDATPAP